MLMFIFKYLSLCFVYFELDKILKETTKATKTTKGTYYELFL